MDLRVKWLGGLAVALSTAAAIWLVAGAETDGTQSKYHYAYVERGDITERVSLVGHVQARKLVEIGAEVSGRIETVQVEENQQIKKGDILATIEAEKFLNEVARSKAKLLQAEAARDRQAATVERLSKKLERRNDVSSKLAYSVEEIEQLQFEKDAAAADLKYAQAAVQLAQSDLERAELERSRTVVRSPVDGIVTERRVSLGQTVNASLETPVLFVVASDLREIQLQANVDEAIVSKINPGFDVTFTADAYGDLQFKATVDRVRTVPAADLNYVAYPALLNATTSAEVPLRPGMTVNITADLIDPVTNVIRVPVDATRYFDADFKPPIPDFIKENLPRDQWEAAAFGYDQGVMIRNNQSRVFVLDDKGNVVPRLVAIGASNYDYLEIVSGNLAEGERVILGLNPNYAQ